MLDLVYCLTFSFLSLSREVSLPCAKIYFDRPVLSHVHGSFASMDVYGLLEIHSCQEC